MTLRGHLMTDVTQEHPSFSTQTFLKEKKFQIFSNSFLMEKYFDSVTVYLNNATY